MSEFKFNKIIRSKLIDLMRSAGVEVIVKELSPTEYYQSLLEKLVEETLEVVNSKGKEELIEELADLLTVIEAICDSKQIASKQLEQVKREKELKKGNFSHRQKVESVKFDKNDPKFKYYYDYYLAQPDKYPEL